MKTYFGTVRSRSRLTIPFDCWMDAEGKGTLTLSFGKKGYFQWEETKGMEKGLAYRIKVPYREGTDVKMIPKDGYVMIKEVLY